MELREITITHADRAWHEAFLRFVPRVFPTISFDRWYAYGGWTDRYTVYAVVEGDDIVASASVFEMDLVVNGERVRGLQLGAVGTLPTHRRRGLHHPIMERVLAGRRDNDLVFLFANDSVLDFYPRFGFERVREHVFQASMQAAPAGAPLRALDLESASDRALLERIARSAEPIATRFGARDYGNIVLWYGCNFFGNALRYAPEHDAIVTVEQSGELLRILDVQAPRTIDLQALLPRLIDAPITTVELGFAPSPYFPEARTAAEYTESALFVRGAARLPHTPFKYPMLAQT